jgi:hypothetical protein
MLEDRIYELYSVKRLVKLKCKDRNKTKDITEYPRIVEQS